MNSGELSTTSLGINGALEIKLSKHVKSRRFLGFVLLSLGRVINSLGVLPTILVTLKDDWVAVVASSDNLVLSGPEERAEGKERGRNRQNRKRRLLRGAGVGDNDAGVMSGESQNISAGRECHVVHPAAVVVVELAAQGLEGETLTPNGGGRALINALDKTGEYTGATVSGASCNQHRIGMPRNGQDGRANGLLNMLGNPPIVFGLVVANTDNSVTGTNCELLAVRRPSDKSRSPVDSQQDKSRLPRAVKLGFPDNCVSVLRASNKSAIARNINRGNGLIVVSKRVTKLEAVAVGVIEFHVGLARNGKQTTVLGERVVGNGQMTKRMGSVRHTERN